MNINCPKYRQRKVVQILKLAMDVSVIGKGTVSVDVNYNGHSFDSLFVIIGNYGRQGASTMYLVDFFIDSLPDKYTVDQIIHVLKQIKMACSEADRLEMAA